MTESSDRVRAFLALPIDEASLAALGPALEGLRHRVERLRWVRPEGIHLTLRFLGDTAAAGLRSLEPSLRRAAEVCSPCEARFGQLGVFPERGAPRVLWLGLEVSRQVHDLQAACESAAVAAGFAPERRPFRSHLTLGRFRDGARRPDLPQVDLDSTRLDRLVLFRSELGPGGAVYAPLAVFPLGGA